jgi:uncharacterized protein DUF4190
MTDKTPPVPPVPPPAPDAATPPQPNPYAPPAAQPNPYAQPTPYGAPGYAYAPRTNTLAIVSLVLSFFVSIGGIICGHIALSQIKRTGEGGRGLALAGVIIGYVFTGFWVLYVIILIIVIVFSASQGLSDYSSY